MGFLLLLFIKLYSKKSSSTSSSKSLKSYSSSNSSKSSKVGSSPYERLRDPTSSSESFGVQENAFGWPFIKVIVKARKVRTNIICGWIKIIGNFVTYYLNIIDPFNTSVA